MNVVYEIIFRIDLGKAITSVGELVQGINDGLSTAGVEERIKIQADVLKLQLQVDRELNKEEEHKMKRLLEAQVIASMPQHDIRLASFVRKSGNVPQSAMP